MIVPFLLASSLLTAQSPTTDSVRFDRLAALGRLWYAARLFHPYLAYRDIDWDGALVAAIPWVIAARTSAEYAAAVQGMLDALGDPATRVERKQVPGSPSTGEPHPVARWTNDSILVITATNYADLDDWSRSRTRFDSLAALVTQARGLVLDLRRRVAGEEGGTLGWVLANSALLGRLVAEPLAGPGQRGRFHSASAAMVHREAVATTRRGSLRTGQRFGPSPALRRSTPPSSSTTARSWHRLRWRCKARGVRASSSKARRATRRSSRRIP